MKKIEAAACRKLGKKQRSRLKIMHAAKGLFEEHGIDNVTFQMIADGADMCRTTVFNHFSTIDELMLAISAQELTDIREYLDQKDLKGMELIVALYDKLIEDTALYPALSSTLINNAILTEEEENPVKILEELTLRGLEEAGVFEPEKAAVLVEGAYYGLINHYHVCNIDFDAEALKRDFRSLISRFTGGGGRW